MSEKDTLLMANNFSFSPLCFLIFWQTFQRSHLQNLSILKNMRFVVHKKKIKEAPSTITLTRKSRCF